MCAADNYYPFQLVTLKYCSEALECGVMLQINVCSRNQPNHKSSRANNPRKQRWVVRG